MSQLLTQKVLHLQKSLIKLKLRIINPTNLKSHRDTFPYKNKQNKYLN